MKRTTSILLLAVVVMFAFSCGGGNKGGEGKLNTEQGTNDSGNTESDTQGEESFDDIINGSTPVLVDFYADWCKPCKTQSPIIDELATELGDKMRVVKVNVDIDVDLADRYGIESIPTLIIFKDGKEVWKAIGLQDKEVIKEAVLNSK